MGFKCGILSLIILLFIPGSAGESISVSCNPQAICALQESEVNLTCSYPNTNIRTVFWFNSNQKDKMMNEEHPEDSPLDSDCPGRVTTKVTSSNSTLTIRDLRKEDSGKYQLMIVTDNGDKLFSSTAVSLTVTVLQVKQTQISLTCSTSCDLTSGPQSYIWYKNGARVFGIGSKQSLTLHSRDPGSYSCSVGTHEEIRSNAVCVNNNCWNVTYTNRRVCTSEGSSVDFPCTYSYPSGVTVKEVFWHYKWFETEPNDLSKDEQFAGRVEFIGDKEKHCTLRIRDVRKTDSGDYYFRIITETKGGIFSGNPGVILKVTGPENSSLLIIVGSLVVVILALILIAAAVWIWWRKSKAQSGECDTSRVNDNTPDRAVTTKPSPGKASEDQDNVQYSSVRFKTSPNPTSYTLPVDMPEEQNVEYAAVNFSKSKAHRQ